MQLIFDCKRQTGVEIKNKKDMKQYLIAIAMVLALSMNANATAQKHRHTPRTEQVSDTVKHTPDAIEAYSDTTATTATASSDADDTTTTRRATITYDMDDEEAVGFLNSFLGGIGGVAVLIPILAILVFGLFLPVIVIVLVFYFINRNRREKYRLAQMAIQNGQPIPDQLLKNDVETLANNSMYNAGIRQMFTGVGLAIFLGIILGDLGVGIGALVFFIGLGKYVIARQSRQDNEMLKDLNGKQEEK